MTDELIEVVAKAIGQLIEGPAEDMDSDWYGRPLWQAYEQEARAAIRVIAPAVLEQAARRAAETNANCYGDPTDVYETMIDAIRALKEGYSHDQ